MKKRYWIGQSCIVAVFTIGLFLIPALNTKSLDLALLDQIQETLLHGPGTERSLTQMACGSLGKQRSLFSEPLKEGDQMRLNAICDGKINAPCDLKSLTYPFLCPVSVADERSLQVFVISAIKSNLFSRALLAIDSSPGLPKSHVLAFQGMVYSKQSSIERSSSDKVSRLRMAIDLLNQAVTLDNKDVVVRTIRYEVFSHIPSFFRDEKTFESDRLFLERGTS